MFVDKLLTPIGPVPFCERRHLRDQDPYGQLPNEALALGISLVVPSVLPMVILAVKKRRSGSDLSGQFQRTIEIPTVLPKTDALAVVSNKQPIDLDVFAWWSRQEHEENNLSSVNLPVWDLPRRLAP